MQSKAEQNRLRLLFLQQHRLNVTLPHRMMHSTVSDDLPRSIVFSLAKELLTFCGPMRMCDDKDEGANDSRWSGRRLYFSFGRGLG